MMPFHLLDMHGSCVQAVLLLPLQLPSHLYSCQLSDSCPLLSMPAALLTLWSYAADNQGATNPIYPDWWLSEPDAQQRRADQQQQQLLLSYPGPGQQQQVWYHCEVAKQWRL
jgi:hypothetical protein